VTRLFNDPTRFVDEATEGFVAANGRWVKQVDGGVVRRHPAAKPTVAVVIGGGSGHYPAFAGLVGQGLAHGAVMGNVFASPSADHVFNVAVNSESGAGVFLSYGNYAGDVLNFDQAQERLVARGIPCQTVTVTDDIISAPPAEANRRRGIAGDLAVFKVAGAAAENGAGLDEVVRIATRANDRCRSFGVAFSGCTLPGADAPLFDVPAGRMAVGMGVHGEPGTSEVDLPSADELAELFVTTLLGERPPSVPATSGARVVALLNGLGAVKYEELFVVYRRVAQLLGDAGITVADSKVGELVTSFDMAGASLTLFWLDDELETLWLAPCATPAFTQTGDGQQLSAVAPVATGDPARDPSVPSTVATSAQSPTKDAELPPSTAESRAASELLVKALQAVRLAVDAEAKELGRLDSVAGDGDHGLGMQRGTVAAAEAAEAASARGAGVRTTLDQAADAWANRAGGASGALWGVALHAFARELSDAERPTSDDLQNGVTAALDEIERVGKAKPGDKTLLDALQPFAIALHDASAEGDASDDAWRRAAGVAQAAAKSTADMLANIGRARLHAQQSLGSPDPGATSFAIVATAAVMALTTSTATSDESASSAG
jgi:dihydroxyacetone kinase